MAFQNEQQNAEFFESDKGLGERVCPDLPLREGGQGRAAVRVLRRWWRWGIAAAPWVWATARRTKCPTQRTKGIADAKKAMVKVKLKGNTIPHEVQGRCGASRVTLIPASEGTGVIAGKKLPLLLEAGRHSRRAVEGLWLDLAEPAEGWARRLAEACGRHRTSPPCKELDPDAEAKRDSSRGGQVSRPQAEWVAARAAATQGPSGRAPRATAPARARRPGTATRAGRTRSSPAAQRGFDNFNFRVEYQVVNVSDLERFDAGATGARRPCPRRASFRTWPSPSDGWGQLSKKSTVVATKFSASAERNPTPWHRSQRHFVEGLKGQGNGFSVDQESASAWCWEH